QMNEVVRQTITQNMRAQFLHQLQIASPVFVVPALLEQIAPDRSTLPVLDSRIRALDSRGEREIPLAALATRPNPLRSRSPAVLLHRGVFQPDVLQDFEKAQHRHPRQKRDVL